MNDIKVVKSAVVDWSYSVEVGQDHREIKRGLPRNNPVVNIKYHKPVGYDNHHYLDVYYEDGSSSREFNINSIVFEGG